MFRKMRQRVSSTERNNGRSPPESPGTPEASEASTTSTVPRRSFLRKKIIELQSLEGGVKRGCRVVCYPDNPQAGAVKWIGKISQIIYIGVEFDNEIGNNFPETKGAPPFPCKFSHSRLVLRNDLILAAEHDPRRRRQKSTTDVEKRASGRQDRNVALADKPSSQDTEGPRASLMLPVETTMFSSALENFYEHFEQTKSSADQVKVKCEKFMTPQEVYKVVNYQTAEVLVDRWTYINTELMTKAVLIQDATKAFEKTWQYEEFLLPVEEMTITVCLSELHKHFSSINGLMLEKRDKLDDLVCTSRRIENLINSQYARINEILREYRNTERTRISCGSDITSMNDSMHALIAQLILLREDEETEQLLIKFAALGANPQVFEERLHKVRQINANIELEIVKSLETLENLSTSYADILTESETLLRFMRHRTDCESSDVNNNLRGGRVAITYDEKEMVKQRLFGLISSTRKLRVSIFDRTALEGILTELKSAWMQLNCDFESEHCEQYDKEQ